MKLRLQYLVFIFPLVGVATLVTSHAALVSLTAQAQFGAANAKRATPAVV